MPLQSGGQMSFADVYNEITGESLSNPLISITQAELGLLQNSSGQTIPLNQESTKKPDGNLPTVFPTEWYEYCQVCFQPKPFITISKSAPSQAFNGQELAFTITITNNGQATTNGTITVQDTLQNNINFLSVSGTNWSASTQGQVVTCLFTGILAVGQSASFIIYTTTYVNGTYYNYANVVGGGDTIVKYSNTTATNVITQTFTSTTTLRLDRNFQRNNCGNYGTGTIEQIFSPYFTRSYTSFISQNDADTRSYALAYNDANDWLNVNGQNQANSQGSCSYNYPILQLNKTMSDVSLNVNSESDVTINVQIFNQNTSGTLNITDTLFGNLRYVTLIGFPLGWSITVVGQTVTLSTSQSLPNGYNQDLVFRVRAVATGNFSNRANGNGGSIVNNFAESNEVNGTVVGSPNYSLTTNSINNTYSINNKLCVPTDDAYYQAFITINNSSSNNDLLVVQAFMINGINTSDCLFFYNDTYFDAFPYGSFVQFVAKNGPSIPVGQYEFRIKFNLFMDFYRGFEYSEGEGSRSNVTRNDTGQVLSRNQSINFVFYKNNVYQSESQAQLRWANNYFIRPIFRFADKTTNQTVPNTFSNLFVAYNNYYLDISDIGFQFANNRGFVYPDLPYFNPVRDNFNSGNNPLPYDYRYPTFVNGRPGFSIDTQIQLRQRYDPLNSDRVVIKSDAGFPNLLINIDSEFNEPKVRILEIKINVVNGQLEYGGGP